VATVRIDLDASEVEWEFAPGSTVRGFAYNGQVPGPLVEATVGDTVEVQLRNDLTQATTIHWHGVRVPAEMDGTEPVVRPWEQFAYRFVVPDAGTFWYHSHTNETEQLERGLYGALIVHDPGDGEPRFDRERVLILDDLKLDACGEVAPFGDEHEHHAGREGDVRLVNGEQEPELDEIAGGTVERWRVVNAANTRFVRFSIGGRPFTIIGTDGGLLPRPLPATEILITPGERFDLAVGPFEEEEELAIDALPYDRGKGETPQERFATLSVGKTVPSNAEVPERLRAIDALVDPDTEATRTIDLKSLMHAGHEQRADPVRLGEVQVWDLVNETGQDHPFHLHGFFFQVLLDNGEPPPILAWKDTINVPRKSQTRIAWLPADRPGEWMYHCHILEHHAMGMMAHFSVVP
jgi:FtsP/CotA-like multicopper oxidase with cupredoxin domain